MSFHILFFRLVEVIIRDEAFEASVLPHAFLQA
jgi:hypothetical protein